VKLGRTGCATGALACSISARRVTFVRRPTRSARRFCMVNPSIIFQAVGPRFVLASCMARTSSDYAICRARVPLYLAELNESTRTVVVFAAWLYHASIGSFRCVRIAPCCGYTSSHVVLRWVVALTSAIAMTYVGAPLETFSTRCVVSRVHSRRKAGRLSWRRRVSRRRHHEGYGYW